MTHATYPQPPGPSQPQYLGSASPPDWEQRARSPRRTVQLLAHASEWCKRSFRNSPPPAGSPKLLSPPQVGGASSAAVWELHMQTLFFAALAEGFRGGISSTSRVEMREEQTQQFFKQETWRHTVYVFLPATTIYLLLLKSRWNGHCWQKENLKIEQET